MPEYFQREAEDFTRPQRHLYEDYRNILEIHMKNRVILRNFCD